MSCTNKLETLSPSTIKDRILRLAMAKAKSKAKQSENFEYGLKMFTERNTLAYYLAEFINNVRCSDS
jgi:hypothetical protein